MQHKNYDLFTLIESFINTFYEKNGSIPTNMDISQGTGLSTATVSRYLLQMKKDGIIEFTGHRNIKTKKMMQRTETLTVPVVGSIACGTPSLAEEKIEDYISIPKNFLKNGNYFFLRASGNSMIDIGIYDGDLVLVRQQNYASNGQVAVVLINDDATLKRYYKDTKHHRIRLHPENKSLEDIYIDDCIIQGIAVKAIKDII